MITSRQMSKPHHLASDMPNTMPSNERDSDILIIVPVSIVLYSDPTSSHQVPHHRKDSDRT